MPTLTQVKQFLSLTVVPVLAGALANWLMVHLHFLAAFHLTASSVAGELTQLGVFGVGAGLTWLASHNILKAVYAPQYLGSGK
jgi:hypothetical protein